MKIAVIGVGNILLCDDGIGVYALKYIEENYNFDNEITFVDGGTLGLGLLNYYEEYDTIVFLDTITTNNSDAGDIYKLTQKELLDLGSIKQTAHELEVATLLQTGQFLEKKTDSIVFGIVPDDIESLSIDLTPVLKDTFLEYIDLIISYLNSIGLKSSRYKDEKKLEDIILSFKQVY